MIKDAYQASSRAWSELLHAEVAYLLRNAGIATLHIKGPSVALWLYDDDERPWGDVDILVAPSQMEEALGVLQAAGMQERFAGVTRRTTTDHAITLVRRQAGELAGAGAEVDVHDRFPGIGQEPEAAFAQLWRRREPTRLGHNDLWFPDLTSRALLTVLNTARSQTPQAREDLRRLVAAADEDDWQDVVALSGRLESLPGLRAGLSLDEGGGRRIADRMLSDVPISREWFLRQAGAPRTALRLDELGVVPWRKKASTVGRWLIPPAAIMRMRDPAAKSGARGLFGAHLRRWRDGAQSLPASVCLMLKYRRRVR